MKLDLGRSYKLANVATRQTTMLTIYELREYNGAFLVYGERSAHEIYIPSVVGRVPIAANVSAFPFMDANPLMLAGFIESIEGVPLALIEGSDVYFVPNTHEITGFWNGDRSDREGMLKMVRDLVDLYREYVSLKGVLPEWFAKLLWNQRNVVPNLEMGRRGIFWL